MKHAVFITCILLSLLGWRFAQAEEVYTWTDASGVRVYSDNPPEDPNVKVEMIDKIPFDPAADAQRMEEDRRWREETERRSQEEKAQRDADKAAQEAQAQRIEEEKKAAEAQAEAALEKERLQRKAEEARRNKKKNPKPTPYK